MSTAMNVTAEKRNAPAKILKIPEIRIILKISDEIYSKIYSSLNFLAKFRSFWILFFWALLGDSGTSYVVVLGRTVKFIIIR